MIGSDGLILQALATSTCEDQTVLTYFFFKKSMTAKMLLELCVFLRQPTPKKLTLRFKSTSTSSIDPYSLIGKKQGKN